MSEQNLEEVFDDVVEDQVEDTQEQEVEQKEEKPAPRGYMSKEAWIEAGRDPDDWVSPEVFKERGERIKMKLELQKDFENRIKNLNLLHQKQLEIQREDLLRQRDDAIDTADKAAVRSLDKKLKELDDLEELNRVEEAQPIVIPPEVAEWEDENPWVYDPSDPRLPVAKRTYQKAISEGKTPASALRAVDRVLSEKFLDTRKKPSQIAEGSRSVGSRDEEKITMSSLTPTEKKIWESGIFNDQKAFLKAVADDRKAGKK